MTESPRRIDLTQPVGMRQGDLSGTPMGMLEVKRRLGKVVLHDSHGISHLAGVLHDVVWGEVPTMQTGYAKAAMLDNGTLVLYAPTPEGATLPQLDDSLSNDELARLQLERRLANTRGPADQDVDSTLLRAVAEDAA